MMQCATCNKSSFAPKLKLLEKQWKRKILLEQEKNSNVLEMKNTNSFHMKLKHEKHCNATWIEFEFIIDLIELNSNTLKGIWIQLNWIPIQFNLFNNYF
jgi:hypothetical protein